MISPTAERQGIDPRRRVSIDQPKRLIAESAPRTPDHHEEDDHALDDGHHEFGDQQHHGPGRPRAASQRIGWVIRFTASASADRRQPPAERSAAGRLATDQPSVAEGQQVGGELDDAGQQQRDREARTSPGPTTEESTVASLPADRAS